MTLTKVLVHFVWSVKHREDLLSAENSPIIFRHLKEVAAQKGILLDTTGGYRNHIHCLVFLKPGQPLSFIAKNLKGESSWWINQNGLSVSHFSWQNDYYAVSVNPASINIIRNYINNQEQHHSNLSFKDEVRLMK
jgi:REP element-mobilizing transposase RayT